MTPTPRTPERGMEMVVDIVALRKIAEAATPGDWHADRHRCYVWGPKEEMVADTGGPSGLPEGAIVRMRGVGGGLPIDANLAHICTFSPATVLRLLDALDLATPAPAASARSDAVRLWKDMEKIAAMSPRPGGVGQIARDALRIPLREPAASAPAVALREARAMLVANDAKVTALEADDAKAADAAFAREQEAKRRMYALLRGDVTPVVSAPALLEARAPREPSYPLVDLAQDEETILVKINGRLIEAFNQSPGGFKRASEMIDRIDGALALLPVEEHVGATFRNLLRQWLTAADSGCWRDRANLSIAAHPVADDTRAVLDASAASAPAGEDRGEVISDPFLLEPVFRAYADEEISIGRARECARLWAEGKPFSLPALLEDRSPAAEPRARAEGEEK